MPFINKKQLRTSIFSESPSSESIAQKKLIIESKKYDKFKNYDIFLSHSHDDAKYIYLLKQYLEERFDYSVYVDWINDANENEKPITEENAEKIRKRLKNCKCLLYAFTENSKKSKWTPWELGYADGNKGKAAILPIKDKYDGSDIYMGQEYLGIYPYIIYEDSTLKICTNFLSCSEFKKWLQ